MELTDGTIIETGEVITKSQLKTVKVKNDITFTAITKIKTHIVKYETDGNLDINIEQEEKNYGSNPTLITITEHEGYEFKYWIANIDVKLTDGTTIEKGKEITHNQINTIIVSSDITLTTVAKIKTYLQNQLLLKTEDFKL